MEYYGDYMVLEITKFDYISTTIHSQKNSFQNMDPGIKGET